MTDKDFNKLRQGVRFGNFFTSYGRVEQIVGMTIEASGMSCNVGDVCIIYTNDGQEVECEAVGFRGALALLMPYNDTDGVGYGNPVFNTHKKLQVKMSDALIGRTVDALGNPIDGKGEIKGNSYYSINGKPSNPMTRPAISEPIELGIKAIDGMLTIGKGQRMGIFAGSGVGKSTLMGMIARNVTADVNVIALVGERGRELVEFLNKDLGEEGAKRSVVVVATSDMSAMLRNKCALTATTIAEYFRDKGMNVLLMMDSLTRYCMAQREIGLSTGEPPVARGYPPSIYASLPKLLERCGNFEKGSITGIYTVLVEGDDSNEPVSDTVRGIIDGHIMLSRKIAMKNHYPAIDVLASLSRLMSAIASSEQKQMAGKIRNLMSIYNENQDLISIGAYKSGSNPELDTAIKKIGAINEFLQQTVDVRFSHKETVDIMRKILA
ncbi:MAG: flagellar protein export ATPase FliI [Oscillospiraceae bacterium]|nr:flagellar protein export ATPase FliI [Oscillospiraceae bacterium]MBQ8883037.1 flagellar protein export ATPase FliI [Oscillospiraceae bacterium]